MKSLPSRPPVSMKRKCIKTPQNNQKDFDREGSHVEPELMDVLCVCVRMCVCGLCGSWW